MIRINEDPNGPKDFRVKKKERKTPSMNLKGHYVLTATVMGLLMKTTLAFNQGLASVHENVAINISVYSGI